MLKSSLIGDVIIELTEIDSTNNYAMRLLSEGMADHGLVVRADFQTQGKGQHGSIWLSEESKNLLFSIILDTKYLKLDQQFTLSAMTTVVLAESFMKDYTLPNISIKWPNDIYLGNKKISGILIENLLRGSSWTNSVVGIGININQTNFPDALRATSFSVELKKNIKVKAVLKSILSSYNKCFQKLLSDPLYFHELYNKYLMQQGSMVSYMHNFEMLKGKLIQVNLQGQLEIEVNNKIKKYNHKEIELLIS